MIDLTDFGDQVKQLRDAAGFSQREMAKRLRISPGYLARIETADCRPPSEEVIVRMAEVLNMKSEILLALAGKIPSDVRELIRIQPFNLSQLVKIYATRPTEENYLLCKWLLDLNQMAWSQAEGCSIPLMKLSWDEFTVKLFSRESLAGEWLCSFIEQNR